MQNRNCVPRGTQASSMRPWATGFFYIFTVLCTHVFSGIFAHTAASFSGFRLQAQWVRLQPAASGFRLQASGFRDGLLLLLLLWYHQCVNVNSLVSINLWMFLDSIGEHIAAKMMRIPRIWPILLEMKVSKLRHRWTVHWVNRKGLG